VAVLKKRDGYIPQQKNDYNMNIFFPVFSTIFTGKINIMQFPDTLRYTKDHEWIKVDGDTATIGITEFAQRELGDIVFVDIDAKGKNLGANEVFGTVEAVKTVSDLYLPVAGTITEVNPELEGNPEYVNQDPYGKGWMVKMTVNDVAELDGLMDAGAYTALVGA
jgi:glycine cleavage system H protein